MRETDPSAHESCQRRIGPQVVKQSGNGRLDDIGTVDLIRPAPHLECGSHVTESGVNDGNINGEM